MRQLPLSIPERKFILKAASEFKRLDGRKLDEFRPFHIQFGRDWGSCFVTLGETKVLAAVSCEIQEPKATRPNEGILFINIEITPMAAPHFETGTRSELNVHLNRMLEKCLKESKAVDLESLCVVADEKVWVLRVDVNIVNHEGNLLDCASMAALAALAHFRRPDVTTDGEDIKVHDSSEKDPIKTTLHHYPVCVSFALMSESNTLISDPNALEERVADANLVFGVNAYKELCALHLGGTAVLPPKDILRCAGRAATRAKDSIQSLKEALNKDLEDRLAEKPIGFVNSLQTNKFTSLSQDRLKIQLSKFKISESLKVDYGDYRIGDDQEDEKMEEEATTEMEITKEECEVVDLGDHSAELVSKKHYSSKKKRLKLDDSKEIIYGEGGPSQWVFEVKENSEVASDSDSANTDEISVVPAPVKDVENVVLSGDSDEEVVHVMVSKDLEVADMVKVPTKKQIQFLPKKHTNKKKGKKSKT